MHLASVRFLDVEMISLAHILLTEFSAEVGARHVLKRTQLELRGAARFLNKLRAGPRA